MFSTIDITPNVFTSKPNPLNDNLVCIYEKRVSNEPRLLFMLDKANYDNDRDFNESIEFIIESLNKNL